MGPPWVPKEAMLLSDPWPEAPLSYEVLGFFLGFLAFYRISYSFLGFL